MYIIGDCVIILIDINIKETLTMAKVEKNLARIYESNETLRRLLDTSWKERFNSNQLYEIREGLSNDIDAAVYAISAFDDKQMFHIRKALEAGVEYRDFTLPCINFEYMKDQVASRK